MKAPTEPEGHGTIPDQLPGEYHGDHGVNKHRDALLRQGQIAGENAKDILQQHHQNVTEEAQDNLGKFHPIPHRIPGHRHGKNTDDRGDHQAGDCERRDLNIGHLVHHQKEKRRPTRRAALSVSIISG